MKYNQAHYNAQRYNINGTFHFTSFSETLTESDATQLADTIKVLSESLSSVDATILFSIDLSLIDFVFLEDVIQVQFSNKALSDTVRLADWLSIERNPVSNEWYN